MSFIFKRDTQFEYLSYKKSRIWTYIYNRRYDLRSLPFKSGKALNVIEGIDATVTLSPPVAIISMDKHVPTNILQDALSKVGDYTIEIMQDAAHTNHSNYKEMSGMLQEYGDCKRNCVK